MALAMHKRLTKELPQLGKKTLASDGIALDDDNVVNTLSSKFVVLLAGPRDCPFEGGVFRLQVDVPAKYPMEPPSIRFVTKMFHPNVGSGHTPGAICLDILRKEAWSPILTLDRVLLSIASLLADPNPRSPMNSEAAKLYDNNRPAYNKRVQEFVKLHAKPTGTSAGAWTGDLGTADDTAPASSEADTKPVDNALSSPALSKPAPSAIVSEEVFIVDVSDDEKEPVAKKARQA